MFRDTRGRKRTLRIVDRDRRGSWAELRRTAYVADGTELKRATAVTGEPNTSKVSGVPAREGAIRLDPDDLLVLTRDAAPGRDASFDSAGRVLSPARISCTLPQIFADVQPGERVCLDDGKITGVAESVSLSEVRIRIRHTPARGARLQGGQGHQSPGQQAAPACADR